MESLCRLHGAICCRGVGFALIDDFSNIRWNLSVLRMPFALFSNDISMMLLCYWFILLGIILYRMLSFNKSFEILLCRLIPTDFTWHPYGKNFIARNDRKQMESGVKYSKIVTWKFAATYRKFAFLEIYIHRKKSWKLIRLFFLILSFWQVDYWERMAAGN